MLQITRAQPPVLRGAITVTPGMKDVAKKAGFFAGVVGVLAGVVWLASR
jgi:hypothetical protein